MQRGVSEQIAEKMTTQPPVSRARLELFLSSVSMMRAELRPDQYETFDCYVELTTRRFERSIKRDSATANDKGSL